MGSIPKFLASVITILVGVVVCISFIISSVVVNSARTYHSSVIDHIEASGFEEITIEKCIQAAEDDNYHLTVEKVVSGESESYYFYKVTLQYGLYAPIFGKVHTGSLVGYALPGAHVVQGAVNDAAKAPGLYETGSDYSVLVKDWNELVSNGIVTVTGGVVSTGYVSGTNASAASLDGDLLLPGDGTVTEISSSGFYGCTELTGIKIPDAVETVGQQAFAGCSALNTVEFGAGVTHVNDSAFDSCSGISTVSYSGNLENWCNIAFGNGLANPVYYGADLYVGGKLVVNLTVPATVSSIENAFIGCGSLENVVVPANGALTGISSYAFAGCDNLKTVMIGSGVTSIGENAFQGCNLEIVTIPASVTTIGSYAFKGCGYLTDIIYRGTTTDWSNVGLGTDWNNSTGTYMIHCTDGVLAKS